MGISAKLQSFAEFAHLGQVKSYREEKMAAALASVFVIASLAQAKPQVGFGFPSSSTSWNRGCRTRAPPCLGAPASSPSSTTGRPTSSAHTQTRQLPGAPQLLTPTTRL